jgi:hypothetical protein
MTTIRIDNVRGIVTGDPQPVYRDGEAVGTSRRIEIWTHDSRIELDLTADEAAVLAFPSDPVERQQLHFARHDLAVYRHALEQIVKTNRDPVIVALEVLGDD